jgi:putative transposase
MLKPKYDARMALLKHQIQMLRSRIDASRTVPTSEERTELLRLGDLCNHDADELLTVVVPEAYRIWVRKLKKGVAFKRSSFSRIAETIRRLVHPSRARTIVGVTDASVANCKS